MQVLIPSAKLVSEELQKLGKLPAIVYPVNNRTVFSYLYMQYKQVGLIKILCYEEANKVHKKLDNYKGVKIIDIPMLSDLAYTIYYGLEDSGSAIINFGDTIVMDNIYENDVDSFYYAEDYVSEKWTYFNIDNGRLDEIYDKKNKYAHNLKREKLFVGVFYLSDSKYFKRCLENSFINHNDTVSVFYQALREYSKKYALKAIKTLNWFDIGHSDKYYNTQLEVKAREFNHIDIDKDRGILTKYSDNKDKFIGEIKWYIKLPSDIEYMRPRIFNYSLDYNNLFVSMEYYAYHTVHELFVNGDLELWQWEMIFDRIKYICKDMNRYKMRDEKIKISLEEMYLKKTIQRFNELKKNEKFNNFFKSSIIVNGRKYKCLNDILDCLEKIIPNMLYDVDEFNIIHGDLCFSNMMIDNNLSFIKVIDPRGKFGAFDIYGDFRYELAKLIHSVDGKYDYIIKDLFNLSYKENYIDFQILDKDRDFDLYKVFIKVFKKEIGKDLKKIELIESLLFLSMIPLHEESFEHQLVMLGTGLEILNKVVNVEE